jgi:hypothetical protein
MPLLESQLVHPVRLALESIPREYPHASQGTLYSQASVQSPRELWPVFFGCYDWHSAVHNHWQIVRFLRAMPHAPLADEVVSLLTWQFQPQQFAQEVAYLRRNPLFEMPYGVAWALLLCAEVEQLSQESGTWRSASRSWNTHLAPLREVALDNTLAWLDGLLVPNRAGAHANTAFACGLMFDAASVISTSLPRDSAGVASTKVIQAIVSLFHRCFIACPRIPVACEPLGYDFLSPRLCEVDLARRIVPPEEFAAWIADSISELLSLRPVQLVRPEDGQQSHFDGLNISRAWMLASIADALRSDGALKAQLHELAKQHADAGLAGSSHHHYSGQHWLGSYSMYWLTRGSDEVTK